MDTPSINPPRIQAVGEYCAVCGTPREPTLAGGTGAGGSRGSKTAGYRLGKGIALAVAGALGLLAIVYLLGQATASASVSARCEPSPALRCTLTISNHSIWPERIDIGSIMVDGKPIGSTGGGIAWPFGNASVVLHDQNGTAMLAVNTLAYSAGPLLGPGRFAQSVTIQSSLPASDAGTGAATAVDDDQETADGPAAWHDAPPGKGRCKPGYGYGDKNHCHSGPPGHRR